MEQPDNTQLNFDDFPNLWCQQLEAAWLPMAASLARAIKTGQQLIGIHGGQGSGKSTLALGLKKILQHTYHLRVAILSIDDFYLTQQERLALAQSVHPLLRTRGVPGTHDMALMDQCVTQLLDPSATKTTSIPIFDKLTDDRAPVAQSLKGPFDAVIIEGWCIATPPQPPHLLLEDCNSLETMEDQDGIWRQWVNRQLIEIYQPFFAKLQRLVMLKVPSIEQIIQWRTEQENDNRGRAKINQKSDQQAMGMTDQEIIRFVQHYERLTLWSLQTLPEKADILVTLDKNHAVADVNFHSSLLQR